MPTPSTIKRNVTLDSVRIFACLWVWLYHWTGNAQTWAEFSQPVHLSFSFIPTHIQDFLNRGHLGVDLFFVLSGCVIANSALHNSPIAFAKNRFTRLFPAYFITSIVTIAFYGLAGGNRGILLGFYWLSGFPLLFTSRPYIAPAWTLHHEIWFYVLIFLVLRFGKIKKKDLIIFANLGSFAIFSSLIFCHFTETRLASNSFVLLLPYFLFGMFTQLLDSANLWRYSSLGFFVSSLLVIRELYFNSGSESYFVAFTIFMLISIFITISKVETTQEWSPPKSVQLTIRKLALMTYPIYLLHLTAGGALISYLYANGLPIWFAIFLSGFFVTITSWWIVQIFEPRFKVMVTSFRN